MARPHDRLEKTAATLTDVAREAGLAIATASRALSGRGYVSSAAREKVLDAARRLNYAPSRAAQALRRADRRALGVVVPDLGNRVWATWLHAAGLVANRHGYVLLICDTQRSAELAEQQLTWLREERVAGILLGGAAGAERLREKFRDTGIPIAPELPRRCHRRHPRYDEEWPATEVAFRRLVSLGHRKIAYFTPPGDVLLQELRIEALQGALAAAGRGRAAQVVVAVDSAEACGREALRLASSAVHPTAFVAGTSDLTVPILAALADVNLSICDEVSVLGFGEGEWERVYRPGISVVRHDYAAVASALMEQLIGRIEAWPEPPAVPVFPAEFIDRGSIGPPPTAQTRRRIRQKR